MLSVIIATLNSERALVPTLAALVPGATSGLISEVLVADAGSQDETAAVADVAGCNFLLMEGPLGRRLKTAAVAARAPWLLFLRPGIVLDGPWTSEVGRFVQHPVRDLQAAVFRRGRASPSALRELMLTFAAALGAPPHPEQGLLISKQFYDTLGGHSERSSDPEYELMRRIGGPRSARLATSAFDPGGA
jgi:glycosyltransferase involved in cell wall biosynthesis